MTEPLRLTDLSDGMYGCGAHCHVKFGTWRRALYYAFVAVREVLAALPFDLARAYRGTSGNRLRVEHGVGFDAGATRIALYVHYSATGQISEMVCQQLTLLNQSGFSVVFITMADCIPDADWQAVRHLAVLMVQRRNYGLDFGAWRDVVPEVRRHWPVPHELLLANDSILGPIYPLAPSIDMMRMGGNGLFGLTESLQSSPHLQSYMLLARGISAVDDLMAFIETLYISHSKWLLIRMSEVRLSQWMRRRGHRIAVVFSYERLVRAALADPEERRRLQGVYKRFHNLDQLSRDEAISALHCWPLNPTHHLWRVLVTQFDYPFLKTELIRRNPARLPGVTDWQAVVPANSPCPLHVIKAHLLTLNISGG